MAVQLLIGAVVLYALATRGQTEEGDQRRPGFLEILPRNDAVARTLGTLFSGQHAARFLAICKAF
jgi:hypothetical protein